LRSFFPAPCQPDDRAKLRQFGYEGNVDVAFRVKAEA